jgi:hypothetical protein
VGTRTGAARLKGGDAAGTAWMCDPQSEASTEHPAVSTLPTGRQAQTCLSAACAPRGGAEHCEYRGTQGSLNRNPSEGLQGNGERPPAIARWMLSALGASVAAQIAVRPPSTGMMAPVT